MLSTYQAGKLIFLSPKDEHSLVQLPRTYNKVMGVGLHEEKMVLATKDEVIVLRNSPALAHHYPRKPATYDSLFMPRATYNTGLVDIHDIDFTDNHQIVAVNTSFSCLVTIDDNYSFTPIWHPPFISRLASEDRCHLNGMALVNGHPKYVTAFNQGDTPQSWRSEVTTGGIIMDIDSNECIAQNLPMPHSPRWWNDELYVLLSAKGALAKVDIETGQYDIVMQTKGFVRGLAFYGDYAFIGLSKLRQNSSTFGQLPFAKEAQQAGILVVHLPTGALIGQMIYQATVDEIYDIQVLPNSIRPNALNMERPDYKMGLHIPDTTFWAPLEE